jgi:tetratricopeptide (TPR) repeat protein
MMTSTFRWCASALLALLVCAAPLSVSAQSAQGTQAEPAPSTATPATPPAAPAGPAPKTAKEFVTRATQEFQANQFDKAIADYQAAYQQKQLPTLLFNIAQANRKAEQFQEALTYYERFLKDDPKSPLAPEAEAQLAFVRAKLDAQKLTTEREALERLAKQRAEEAEALAKAREEERKKAEAALLLATAQKTPAYKKKWFWPVLVGSVVVAGVAIGVGVALGLPKQPASDLGPHMVQF